MNFDGSKRLEGAGAGVILVSPEGDKLKYVLRMTFPNASNNEAEYEALIHGMKMAKACGATRLKIFGDSQLVAQQVMNQCDAVNESMIAYKEVYNELEKLFDGCEVNHISRMSNDEADVLANIGSQCLAIPPGATYQRTMQRCLKDQIGRNVHAYVDDIAVMTRKGSDLISDLTETFENLRRLDRAPDATEPEPDMGYALRRIQAASRLRSRVTLKSPTGEELQYVLLHFEATNNMAEYEALLHGLRIAKEIGIKHIICCGDSDLVASK
ncbi:hypothetical protein QYE76_018022 [Lolium multiflorum]|uniref:RNase H type-1 domain-containing protein n=1 Tax=Lolium multiflorum TaxID=4521 RepID=A0AAD8VDU1_LOLMU|nr:hypothetical protein QYE76_018022 [Lolium multiflorum]